MKQQETDKPHRGREEPKGRRPYLKPVLEQLGNVNELTKGGAGTTGDGKLRRFS